MEDLSHLQNEIIKSTIDQQTKQMDAKLFEALKKHGYDVDYSNMKEFAANHKMEKLIYEGLNTLIVDNKPICIWTEWEAEPINLSNYEYKINASFKFAIL